MRKTLRIKISVAGAPIAAATRLQLSAYIKLRKAHALLREALGRRGEESYCFLQDERVFGNPALNADYVEDDSTFNLGYCLCLPGHTVDYIVGGDRHVIELESIEVVAPKNAADPRSAALHRSSR